MRIRIVRESKSKMSSLCFVLHANWRKLSFHPQKIALFCVCDVVMRMMRQRLLTPHTQSPAAMHAGSSALVCQSHQPSSFFRDGNPRLLSWTHSAYLGLYLGPSLQHASSVGLILNIKTGYISHQFHCTYNDCFETPRLQGETQGIHIGKLSLNSWAMSMT